MKLLQSLSGKTILLIFTIFAVSFAPKLADITSGEDDCLCGFDGYGYYMYLPHLFNEGNLDIKQEWAQKLQNEYCEGIYAYQIVRTETGQELNAYQMGQAYLELPAYVIGDLSARIFGYKTDGFSKPYYIAFVLNALLFIFLGLIYLRKLLLLYLDEKTTAISILILYLASNIYTTFFLQHDLQHLYLFALNAIFLYHLVKYMRSDAKKHLLFSAIILGLTVAIRPTQVILGLFPLILFLNAHGLRKAFFKRIWIFPVIGFLWNVPQIAYWWIIGGEPIVLNLHSEDIALSDPNIIDFLFSYKKGWLLYSPVFILAFHGLYVLFRKNRALFWSSLSFLFAYIWVMSSWECWWYAQSYGSRVMVDVYPIIAILIGFSISAWKHRLVKIAGFVFLVVCSLLTILQIHQGFKGYLSYENMTKQHYWYIFGKTTIDNYSEKHLEKDRNNLDENWIEFAKNLPESDYTYSTWNIYTMDSTLHLENTEVTHLEKVSIMDLIPSDEGMIEIEITSKSSDTTQSIVFQSEIFSDYGHYLWNRIDLSLNQTTEFNKQTVLFNLPRIRHSDDEMQFYIVLPAGVTLDIEKIDIKAHILERK